MNQKSLQILPGFWLKLIGMLLMTLDHVGFFMMNVNYGVNDTLFRVGYVFRCIGRAAMPLFVFFVAEAVRHSHKPWHYFLRLMILHAAISIIMSIYVYLIPNSPTPAEMSENAFADLSLIALALILFQQKRWKKALAALPIVFAAFVYVLQVIEKAQDLTIDWFPRFLRPGYSLLGILIGIGFYFSVPLAERFAKKYAETSGIPFEAFQEDKAYQRMKNVLTITMLFAVVVVFWGISYIGYNYDYRPYDNYLMQLQSYCLLAIPFLFLYSGKRGYDSKTFRIVTYLYYPVHLAILFLIFSL